MSEKPNKEEMPAPHEKTIRIQINVQGQKGSEVIVAAGASNHYTDHGSTSDTCCTCTS